VLRQLAGVAAGIVPESAGGDSEGDWVGIKSRSVSDAHFI